MRTRLLLAVIMAFFVTGTLLLGEGITGMVISQSCCFGASCPADYLCDNTRPYQEIPGGNGQSSEMFYMGLGLIAASLAATLALGHPEFPWLRNKGKNGK